MNALPHYQRIYTARQIEDLNLGINADEISCMISAGYQRSHGNKMTVESVMAWRAGHPQFRKCHFRGKSRLSLKELRAMYGPNVRPVDKQKQAAGVASQLSRRGKLRIL